MKPINEIIEKYLVEETDTTTWRNEIAHWREELRKSYAGLKKAREEGKDTAGWERSVESDKKKIAMFQGHLKKAIREKRSKRKSVRGSVRERGGVRGK